jgi:2-polyprenyl-3-methyl-5-hydroxy-6-metoxy-1,4-benzoquinol methylase
MTSHDWDRRYADTELVWSAGPNRLFAAEVAGLAPGRALDLACGEGRTAVWLAEQGWEVTAVDFSHVALQKAHAIAERRGVAPRFVHADLLEYRPSERAFDLVAVLYLQLGAADLALVLSRAAAAVAPGGTFLLISHDLANLTEGHGGPRDAAVLTTADDVVAALTGLDVLRAERVLREVEGADRPAIDVIVRAEARGPG